MAVAKRICLSAVVLAGGLAATSAPSPASRGDGCTIAAPPSQATIEARIPYAEDFCELVSQALAGDVFRSSVIVTPELWHYPGATVSCRLRFGGTGFLTIRNSIPTCRWLARHATGWHFEDQTATAAAAATMSQHPRRPEARPQT
jgi:hypothetical protein